MESSASKPLVKEYMSDDVVTVDVDATVGDVIRMVMENRGHSGFPVTDGDKLEGFVSANDLLGKDEDDGVSEIMATNLVVAEPEMRVDDAARVILRSGIQKLPVVEEDGTIVGIISNSDVIRSQIERVTPSKVWRLMKTLETIHEIDVDEERREVDVTRLTPTQDKIYADELDGRIYELRRGLAEPLVVIENGDLMLLVDGHHRTIAADRLGIEEMDAYVIVVDADVELGIAKTARRSGLETIDDVEIIDYAPHPLIEATQYRQEPSDDV